MDDVKIPVDVNTDDESIVVESTTKLSVIDHELNRHGMGRYHWLIWGVCSLGFMLDLMWAQAYVLALPSLQREFGFTDQQMGNIGTVYGAGMIVGAFIWGVLVDVVGRRAAFYGTALVAGIFGTCFGAMTSFSGLQAMAAFIGLGTGGNIPVDSTITVEYLPKNRFFLLTALALFGQVGTIASTVIAYGFIPNYSCSPTLQSCQLTGGIQPCCSKDANMGWRYIFFTIGGLTLAVFVFRFFVFPFHESPKYLALKGNDRAAVEVVRKVAAFNKHPCDLTVESLYEQCKETQAPVEEKSSVSQRIINEFSRLRLFFGSWKMARVTILVWITWIFDYSAVNVANTFLPTILQRKNIATNVSLKQTYIDYIIIYTPGIVGAVLSALMVRTPLFGRKWTLVFASVMMSVSLFLYTTVNTQASHVGLNVMFVFFQLLFNSALWGWTPEAFPTAIRGSAAGLAMALGILGSTFAPQIASQVFAGPNGSNAVLYLAGGGVLVCPVALLLLPTRDMVASRRF